MTRIDALGIIYGLINSGILSEELEADLELLANKICTDSFDKCEIPEGTISYCEGCKFLKAGETEDLKNIITPLNL